MATGNLVDRIQLTLPHPFPAILQIWRASKLELVMCGDLKKGKVRNAQAT